jgi:hypothetical protein
MAASRAAGILLVTRLLLYPSRLLLAEPGNPVGESSDEWWRIWSGRS